MVPMGEIIAGAWHWYEVLLLEGFCERMCPPWLQETAKAMWSVCKAPQVMDSFSRESIGTDFLEDSSGAGA